MGDVVDLQYAKECESDDNKAVRPASVLRMALDDVEGNDAVLRVMVVAEVRLPDGGSEVNMYRAGCTRHEEVALIELAREFTMRKWLR
jgi:hypothetical protein